MEFGPVDTKLAEGAILAHSLKLNDGTRLKKGLTLTAGDISKLLEQGHQEVIVARLADDDIFEDEAAREIGAVLTSKNTRSEAPFTGRVNLFAESDGLLVIDKTIIDEINGIDPAITVATLPEFSDVNDGRMVATVKIIPYAVSKESLQKVLSVASANAIRVCVYNSKSVGLITTSLPSLKSSVMDKTRNTLSARIESHRSKLTFEERVDHEAEALASKIEEVKDRCDLLIIFGASAISDIMDVVPAAINWAGGKVLRFGMPVDPGNLALLAELNGKIVIGAPGCARSPVENGFDWILHRVLADVPITDADISGMGVGGLLMEIGSRPQPRRETSPGIKSQVHGAILAAGQSRRMGENNKLLAMLDGNSLIKTVSKAATDVANLAKIHVVTGHERAEIEKELQDLPVEFHHNESFAEGLSSSLKVAVEAANAEASALLVMLGDMPGLTTDSISQMLDASAAAESDSIIVATHDGKRGNPVLWPRAYFEELRTVSGDVGARHIIGKHQHKVVEVELGSEASFDLDTPEALAQAGGYFE